MDIYPELDILSERAGSRFWRFSGEATHQRKAAALVVALCISGWRYLLLPKLYPFNKVFCKACLSLPSCRCASRRVTLASSAVPQRGTNARLKTLSGGCRGPGEDQARAAQRKCPSRCGTCAAHLQEILTERLVVQPWLACLDTLPPAGRRVGCSRLTGVNCFVSHCN